MATAIEFNNISKQYRLGVVSTRTLGADLNRWWTINVKHQEDPFLKIGSVNDRSISADSEFVWALRDINFKVDQGEVVGIIGKNGAGKSTLLKLLSKVTAPTIGTINARGRIGSLLEVGTGFHPEMTGRENIYLNGAIMGMTKHEISSKLDEIVDFSGCERYLDTPVKRYSSGMTVRLGFAVAAHLDPEILVVDEVLAVGDAEFQKKAIGKMQDVSKGEGRTVLFVSHNMDSVRNLCHNGVVLNNGTVAYSGCISDAVDYYLQSKAIDPCQFVEIQPNHHTSNMSDPGHRKFEFVDVRILNNPLDIATDEDIELDVTVRRKNPSADICQFTIIIHELSGKRIATFVSPVKQMDLGKDLFKVHLVLKNHYLAQRTYNLQLDLGLKDYANGSVNYDGITDFMTFKVGSLSRKNHLHYGAWDSSYGFILNNNSLSADVE